jgi:hypothetical protein
LLACEDEGMLLDRALVSGKEKKDCSGFLFMPSSLTAANDNCKRKKNRYLSRVPPAGKTLLW